MRTADSDTAFELGKRNNKLKHFLLLDNAITNIWGNPMLAKLTWTHAFCNIHSLYFAFDPHFKNASDHEQWSQTR